MDPSDSDLDAIMPGAKSTARNGKISSNRIEHAAVMYHEPNSLEENTGFGKPGKTDPHLIR